MARQVGEPAGHRLYPAASGSRPFHVVAAARSHPSRHAVRTIANATEAALPESAVTTITEISATFESAEAKTSATAGTRAAASAVILWRRPRDDSDEYAAGKDGESRHLPVGGRSLLKVVPMIWLTRARRYSW
jgi:hypothetical protein